MRDPFAHKEKGSFHYYNIIFLQETFSRVEVEKIWRTQWKGKLFFSHGTSHSCGVITLVRSDLEFEPKCVNTDSQGRYFFLDAVVQGAKYLFANVYAPNKVQQQILFFNNLNKNLDNYADDLERKVSVGGDFNITFNLILDCAGGTPTKKYSVKSVEDLCLDHDLIDIWRIRHPDKKRFTWRQRNPFIQRRLDHWLI